MFNRGEGVRGWVRRVKRLSKGKKRLMDTDNSMVLDRGKGRWKVKGR